MKTAPKLVPRRGTSQRLTPASLLRLFLDLLPSVTLLPHVNYDISGLIPTEHLNEGHNTAFPGSVQSLAGAPHWLTRWR